MKIKEIIVVEGKNDSLKINQSVIADTIETNGSAINKDTLVQIQHAQQKRGVIIFTDPDYPGERIRHIIDQAVPGCKHAFITKQAARSSKSNRKSIGIEHASVEDIKQALSVVYELTSTMQTNIKREDLLYYGLIGASDSRVKREQLGALLKIGYTNGKQLLKRMNMFEITENELKVAMEHILIKGGQGNV